MNGNKAVRGISLSLRNRMSGDRVCFNTGSTALLALCTRAHVCVCIYLLCVWAWGAALMDYLYLLRL